MVATVVSLLVQTVVPPVISCVLPLLYVPVALKVANCPTSTFVPPPIAILTKEGGGGGLTQVNVPVDDEPPNTAVINTVPSDTHEKLARPPTDIRCAIDVLLDAH